MKSRRHVNHKCGIFRLSVHMLAVTNTVLNSGRFEETDDDEQYPETTFTARHASSRLSKVHHWNWIVQMIFPVKYTVLCPESPRNDNSLGALTCWL